MLQYLLFFILLFFILLFFILLFFLCPIMVLLSQESNIKCQEKIFEKLFVVSGYYIKFV